LKRFIEANAYRIAHDAVGAPAFLAAHEVEIRVAAEQWPKIRFHALREHAGLVFQSNPVT
jgi:peptide chain release factor 3